MEIHSFKEIIAGKYYDTLFHLLAAYIEMRPEALSSRSPIVKRPDFAHLTFFDIKKVNISTTGEAELRFDVVVLAKIEIHMKLDGDSYKSDSCKQWYRLECTAVLNAGLNDFSVSDICVYDGLQMHGDNRLSEYLVPLITLSQLENLATDFLSRYYPEALATPTPIIPSVLATRIGLKIKTIRLTNNLSVFGGICFSDCSLPYYDMKTDSHKYLSVRRGTILVDPNVYFMRSVGSVNNTIVHECVHWDKHQLFFKLNHLFDPNAYAIHWRASENLKWKEERSPVDWVEWQANTLAPRIMMPAGPTVVKIKELIAQAKSERGVPASKTIESVALALAKYFDVSKVAAKIRMIELGYTQADGVYNYANGHYVSSYSSGKKSVQKRQNFTIDFRDALASYSQNSRFKEILDAGYFVYVDGHYCLNDPLYIQDSENGSGICLTNYASQHIDECCLLFNLRTMRIHKDHNNDAKPILYRNAVSDTSVHAVYTDSEQNNAILAKAEALKKDTVELVEIQKRLPTSFSETLKAHMRREKYTVDRLAEQSLVSTKTIQRIRNENNYSASLQTIVAICIGLHLPPPLSMDMIRKAGFNFKAANIEQMAYQLLLNSYYQNSIYECNEMLARDGIRPLGREE